MVVSLLRAYQSGDDGVFLPEDAGSAIVWVIFLGVIAGLYIVVSRTRRRAEEEFWERKRQEREGRDDRPDLD